MGVRRAYRAGNRRPRPSPGINRASPQFDGLQLCFTTEDFPIEPSSTHDVVVKYSTGYVLPKIVSVTRNGTAANGIKMLTDPLGGRSIRSNGAGGADANYIILPKPTNDYSSAAGDAGLSIAVWFTNTGTDNGSILGVGSGTGGGRPMIHFNSSNAFSFEYRLNDDQYNGLTGGPDTLGPDIAHLAIISFDFDAATVTAEVDGVEFITDQSDASIGSASFSFNSAAGSDFRLFSKTINTSSVPLGQVIELRWYNRPLSRAVRRAMWLPTTRWSLQRLSQRNLPIFESAVIVRNEYKMHRYL